MGTERAGSRRALVVLGVVAWTSGGCLALAESRDASLGDRGGLRADAGPQDRQVVDTARSDAALPTDTGPGDRGLTSDGAGPTDAVQPSDASDVADAQTRDAAVMDGPRPEGATPDASAVLDAATASDVTTASDVREQLRFDLTFHGSGFGPHVGEELFAAVVLQSDLATALATDSTAVAADGSFTLVFAGELLAGASYDVIYVADHNGNGHCDLAPTDHLWKATVPGPVAGNATLNVTHHTNFYTSCAALP